MTPRLFLFDMDGTLLDSRAAVVDAVAEGLRRAYAEHGLPVAEPDPKLLSDCMGLPSRTYFERAFHADTVPADRRAAFADSYERLTSEEEVAAIARGETRLYDGVEATLSELKARGHRLLLFSNAGRVYFDAVVAGHGLARFFERTLSLGAARDLGLAEDKTGMVAALSDDPARTIVVGDRCHDVDAGRAAGARTVGCLYGFGEASEFDEADWRIARPGDLLDLEL